MWQKQSQPLLFNYILTNTTYIYTLSNPIDGDVRYVGKTLYPKKRFAVHLFGKGKTHCRAWIKNLQKQGLKPKIEIIDQTISESWQWLEQYWISQFRAWGFNLTNLTDGGDGTMNLSSDIRKRKSEIMKKKFADGILKSNFTREGSSKAGKMHLGKKQKPESIQKRIETLNRIYAKTFYRFNKQGILIDTWENASVCAEKTGVSRGMINMVLKGRCRTANGFVFSYNDKLSDEEIKLANTTTADTRKKMGAWHSEETRKKISDKKRGVKVPAERLERRRKSQMKPIVQMDLDGNEIKKFNSLNEAKDELKCNNHALSDALRGKRKTWCGFKWKYSINQSNIIQ